MAAKDKSRTVVLRLISTAKTGFCYYFRRPRQSNHLKLMKYDPKIQKHVLFVEAKNRRLGQKQEYGWTGVLAKAKKAAK